MPTRERDRGAIDMRLHYLGCSGCSDFFCGDLECACAGPIVPLKEYVVSPDAAL